MKNILIHLGYPKTGTTFLQTHVFGNGGNRHYQYLGKYYNGFKEIIRIDEKNEIHVDHSKLSCLDDGTYLYSNEDAIFNLFRNPKNVKYGVEEIKDIMNRLEYGLRPYFDTFIYIMVIRDPIEIIPSIFAQSYGRYFSQNNSINNLSDFIPWFLMYRSELLRYESIKEISSRDIILVEYSSSGNLLINRLRSAHVALETLPLLELKENVRKSGDDKILISERIWLDNLSHITPKKVKNSLNIILRLLKIKFRNRSQRIGSIDLSDLKIISDHYKSRS